MAIKVIDKCKLDENGNPSVVSGTAGATKMYKHPDLLAEAMETNQNITIRPVCTDMNTGEVIARRYILEPVEDN